MNAPTTPVAEINALLSKDGKKYDTDKANKTQYVGIDTVCPSPTNPRKHYPEKDMTELEESIRAHGLLQAIVLRAWPSDYTSNPSPLPYYEIVAGERRWRAAKAAGMKLIEAKILALTDEEVLEIQIIENLQRAGLHPLEEAEGYARMIAEYHYTAESISLKVGKSESYVRARLKLIDLGHEARKAFYAGKLSASTAQLLARVPVMALQEKALREIIDPNFHGDTMSVREAQYLLQHDYMLRLNEAPFPISDPDLVHAAGKCDYCPKRTGNAPDLFDDVKSPDVCTDPECYDKKRQAHIAREAKAAEARGIKAILGEAAAKLMPYGQTSDLKDGLIALDRKCYEDKDHRTYRELLGGDVQPAAIVEDHRTGKMVEVVDKKQMAEALEKAGVKTPRDLDTKRAAAMAKKVKEEGEFRKRLHEEIRKALVIAVRDGGAVLQASEMEMVGRALYQRSWDDVRKKVARLWAMTDAEGDRPGAAIQRAFDNFTPAEWCLFLVDLCLIGETAVAEHSRDELPENLTLMAKEYSIDPATVRKLVAAEGKKNAPSPTQAAQARGDKPAKKPRAKKAAPATAETPVVLAPAELPDTAWKSDQVMNEKPTGTWHAGWPFPTADAEEMNETPIGGEG